MRRTFEIEPQDVCLHTASFAFSASMRQIFVPLCAGATLLVAGETHRRDALDLFNLIRAHQVTVWDTVPSVLRHAIQDASGQNEQHDTFQPIPSLRLIALTGEALTWDLPKAWRDRFSSAAKILNLYSQSETAGTTSAYTIPDSIGPLRGTVPLGCPVEGSILYLLDDDRRPVPVGDVGAIWIGGDRLSDGYVNQPDLTRDRFVEDPFRKTPGARMFRTGDLGRLDTDGTVQLVGRIDQRVNIRGHRIEPAEVENVLREHPGVRETVVTGKADPRGETRLVAYVVPHPVASPTVDGEQRYRLPNNLAIVHLNKHETDFTYRAVFEDQTYLKHGIVLRDHDCIFDVGANIGQFSLLANLICDRPRIYAFEPYPRARAMLVANMQLYDVDCRVFPFGLSKDQRTDSFTAFDGFTILSGLHADIEEEKKLVRNIMANQEREGRLQVDGWHREVEQILDERFAPRVLEVQLRTLSSVIDEESIERINLLKINVEKSEWEVLQGIDEVHWRHIEQVVIKVDMLENLDAIVQLLEAQGLQSVVDQDSVLAGSRIRTVYAVRPSGDRQLIREQAPGAYLRVLPKLEDQMLSPRVLREFAAGRLPEYMLPSFFVLQQSLPVGSNGKLDRASLPEPDWLRPQVEGDYAPPGSPIQQLLASIWSEVLGVAQVGISDEFLDLGGDSLKAIRVLNRVRQKIQVDLPLATLFRETTIERLAKWIENDQGEYVSVTL
jgi:FkbM family methyltransferase